MIGVVGLGAMGGRMATRLAEAGVAVMGFDRDAARRAACPEAADTLAALTAACDTLLLSLPDSPAVEAVMQQVLAAPGAVRLVIDTSTADPASTRRLQGESAAAGIGFVDAPVSGGPAGAAAGRLLVMLGGAAEDADRAETLLAPLARAVVRCGGPGAGNVVKLVNNLLCSAHLLLAGEALRLGQAAGVEPATLAAALAAGSGRSAAIEANLPQWVLNEAYDSGFTMALMAKDVRLAKALGDLGPLGAVTADLVQAALAAHGPGADFNRLVDQGRGRP